MNMPLDLLGSILPVALATIAWHRLADPRHRQTRATGAVLTIGLGALLATMIVDGPAALHQAVLAVGALIAATALAIRPIDQRPPPDRDAQPRIVVLMLGALGLLALGDALEGSLGDPTHIGLTAELLLWPLWIAVVVARTSVKLGARARLLPMASALLVPLGGLTSGLLAMPTLGSWLALVGIAIALPLFPLQGWWVGLMTDASAASRTVAAALLPASALVVLLDLSASTLSRVAPGLTLWASLSIGYAGLRTLAHSELRRLAALLAMASAAVVALGVSTASLSGQGGAALQTLSLTLVIGGLATLFARMPGPGFGLPIAGLGGLGAAAPRLALALTALLLALIQTPGLGGFAAWWLVLAGSTQAVGLAALAALLLLSASVVARTLRRTLYGAPGSLVESRCGAVTVGRAYLFPPLSSGGASRAGP